MHRQVYAHADGRAALVVPAFEYTDLADGVDQKTFPTDKEVTVSFILPLPKLTSVTFRA